MSTPPPPPPPPTPPPPPGPPGGYYPPQYGAPTKPPVAEAWKRIVARFVDGILLFIVNMVLFAALASGDGSFGAFGGTGLSGAKLLLISLVGLAVGYVYDAVLTAKIGGTPMKRAFGMKVVSAADGSPVDLKQASIRWAVPGLIAIIPTLGGIIVFICVIISLVFLFTDSMRQTINDKAAKTIVVNG